MRRGKRDCIRQTDRQTETREAPRGGKGLTDMSSLAKKRVRSVILWQREREREKVSGRASNEVSEQRRGRGTVGGSLI
jgi:hypothetical protein